MKKNYPITNQEYSYDPDFRIISLTDRKGIITHANGDFIETSGFSAEELLRKNHNVVRHPDMPPAAFDDLWQTLKAGQPWMGIVKNRCKNGDHYWVDAYVAPVYEHGEVTGYQSVRVTPAREHVARASRLYERIQAGKRPRRLPFSVGVRGKYFAGLVGVVGASLGFGVVAGGLGALSAVGGLAAGATVSFGLAEVLTRRVRRLARQAKGMFHNGLAQLVYTGSTDELGAIELAMHQQSAKLTTLVTRLEESAEELTDLAQTTAAGVEQTTQGVQQQHSETDQVATAMNEMTATVQEVARNAEQAATAANTADQRAQEGAEVSTEAITAIEGLAAKVSEVGEVINELRSESDNIRSVVDVIRGVAEQTNLLALNAAIEAARAGEHGRGFAVVADEVRNLASRTQQSTQEIHDIIEGLHGKSATAADAMEQAQHSATGGVEQVGRAGEALAEIAESVSTIQSMNAQIASASEEQSSVAEEINRNIVSIRELSEQTAQGAQDTAAGGDRLVRMSAEFAGLIRQSQL